MTIRTRLFSFHIKAKLFNIHLFNCEYKSFLRTENWLQFLKLLLVSSLLIWEKSASPKRGWKGPLAVLKVKHKSRPGERGKARYGLSFLSSQGVPASTRGRVQACSHWRETPLLVGRFVSTKNDPPSIIFYTIPPRKRLFCPPVGSYKKRNHLCSKFRSW